jgi:hypothetical protein
MTFIRMCMNASSAQRPRKTLIPSNDLAGIRRCALELCARSFTLRPMKKYLLCGLLLGCGSSASSTGIAPVSCPTASTLTYANFGSAFMNEHCLSCHQGQSPTLSTQVQIQANNSAILQAAVYTDAMPLNGDVAVSERELLGEWLACGAP